MNTLVKYSFFTIIYVVLTWFISDEVSCAFSGDEICLMNFVVKYVIFMALMIIYDKWIKKLIFKKK
ncbi:hypothetical protein [Myroides pelagicus]|uniref:Uncharacterized protein n=1 Tax=Myroides pelagicus TaxID=270914 RepID=A0A7K1GN07_9FLAO|nr:hypothetical protein [Myroides pelagicus]MEC4114395.1 hypothetical protein [Myroides pelagicus]MTH30120.1 hypothetical protein [Myroides pelagicus]